MYKFDAIREKENIVQWIKDYFHINGINSKCIIGISGGTDSSVVAALCVEALGNDNVYGILMPCGLQKDINYSYDLCKELNIKYHEIDLFDTYNTFINEINFNLDKDRIDNKIMSNILPRIRMTTLYTMSAILQGRVANTSNLSEITIGWETKWGDNVGDFSPLREYTKTEVKEIGNLLLDTKYVSKEPEDGMCGFSDEHMFGFTYEILDKYIRTGVCNSPIIRDTIICMNKASYHKNKILSCNPDLFNYIKDTNN